MTVVLGIATEEYSILVTDTRMCFERGLESKFDDGTVKLKPLNYPHGWYAGVGHSIYLDEFYHLVSRCLISTREEYLNAMSQVITEQLEHNSAQLMDIARSVSYRTYICEGNLAIELFYIDRTTNQTSVMTYPSNRIVVGFPSNYTEEMQRALIRSYGIDIDQSGDFPDNMIKFLNIFKEISTISHSVSEICEIGILKKNGLIKKYSFSGNIDDLLNSDTTLSLL